MGHEIADGRNKNIRVHDLHGIDTARVTFRQIRARERKPTEGRLPTRVGSVIGSQYLTGAIELIQPGAEKPAHTAHGIGWIWIRGIVYIRTARVTWIGWTQPVCGR